MYSNKATFLHSHIYVFIFMIDLCSLYSVVSDGVLCGPRLQLFVVFPEVFLGFPTEVFGRSGGIVEWPSKLQTTNLCGLFRLQDTLNPNFTFMQWKFSQITIKDNILNKN